MKIKALPPGPVGSWDNPRHVGADPTARQFETFGRMVLGILDSAPDWNADVRERIGEAAQAAGLVSHEGTPVIDSILKRRSRKGAPA